ncbi:hypothetical protein HPB51_014981 [Rhipicephalus microplus]|uniref:Tick transposon n=1 Tax=Rhipicephalus microplus TaxID=6941 RepID=A0A9J6DHB4_RHIMP|nr:hypothetical protein HPB51_014981 [Rhipicephalus microplus]
MSAVNALRFLTFLQLCFLPALAQTSTEKNDVKTENTDAFEILASIPYAEAIKDTNTNPLFKCLTARRIVFDPISPSATYEWSLNAGDGQPRKHATFYFTPGATLDTATVVINSNDSTRQTARYPYTDYTTCGIMTLDFEGHLQSGGEGPPTRSAPDHVAHSQWRIHRLAEGSARRVWRFCFKYTIRLIPAHVGISGNKAADELAKEAHSPGTPVTTAVSTFDVARLRTRCFVTARHPDPRVVAGQPPRPLPKTGFSREERALLLRLRIGCYRSAERVHRQSGRGDPNCRHCPQPKTLHHIIFKCEEYSNARRSLLDAYSKLGLSTSPVEVILFSRAHACLVKRAQAALIAFLKTSALFERL